MPIKLSSKDQKSLDAMLDTLLAAHAAGEVTAAEVRGALAHVITAAAIQNEGEVRGWLKPETVARWKADLKPMRRSD